MFSRLKFGIRKDSDEAEYSDDFEEDDDDDEDDDRNYGDDDSDNDDHNEEEEEEEGGDTSQSEHYAGVPSSSGTQEELKSRKKFPGRKFKFSLKPGKSSSEASYEELREKTDQLQEEKEAAQSKIMKLEKCTEIEAVEERDDLQAVVIKLQNTIEDLAIQSCKVEGWLWKRGVKGPTGRNWRYRWFISENNGRLYYYRKGNQLTLRGFIDLDKITEVQDLPASEENVENSCFNLLLPSRTYEMKAKDEEEKLRWLNALEHLTKWAKRKAS